MRSLLIAVALCAAPVTAFAGDLTPDAANQVVDELVRGLDTYMDPAIAAKVQARLRERRADYAQLEDRKAFAQAVSADMIAASHDGHLKVYVDTVDAGRGARLSESEREAADRYDTYGFGSVRRLPGNIGYLKLRNFTGREEGAAMADAVMTVLKDTDALIIDLRENGGGGGSMSSALIGHLSRTAIPMVEIAWREADGSTTTMRNAARTPPSGPLYADKPVYVLTAKRTYSAAEEFAYDLKAAKRAVLVGETSGGGANPANRLIALSYGFRTFIPNGKATHPTTGANWEGVGIAPDVPTSAAEALTTAYGLALQATKPAVVTASIQKERDRVLADPRGALTAEGL